MSCRSLADRVDALLPQTQCTKCGYDGCRPYAEAIAQGACVLDLRDAAEFGDDQTLMQLASQIQRITQSTGFGVVLFRAGAAPWHDDLCCYRRLVALRQDPSIALFTSLNLWDICAVIARSRAFIGSSLHGSIVAAAYALPCLGLLRPRELPQTSKQTAFWSTWSPAGLPAAVPIEALADGMREAMATDPGERAKLSKRLVDACRASFPSDLG